jgi:hypothetical protein
MQPPCKRQIGVQFLAGAPFAFLLVRSAGPPLVRRKGRIEVYEEHHARLAQRQRQCAQTASSRSSNLRSRTKSPCSPMAEARGLNPRQCVFESRHGYASAVQRQRRRLQIPHSRVVVTLGVPSFTRLAQRKSVGPTNRRSRYRNSQRVPCVSSSAAERSRDMR